MGDHVRDKLEGIVRRYGREVAEDPKRCEGLLRDLCGPHPKEIHVLVQAVRVGIVADLNSPGHGLPAAALIARLARNLHDQTAITEEFCRWAVEAWASALGLISIQGPRPRPGLTEDDAVVLRREGEAKLADRLREVYSRTNGNPTSEDTAAFNQMIKQYQVSAERAKDIVARVHQEWITAEQRRRSEEALAREQRSEAARQHVARAEAELGSGRYDDAIAGASSALKLDPGCASAYAVRAEAYRMKSRHDRAIADASEAIRLAPDHVMAYGVRAAAHLVKGEYIRAIDDATEAIRRFPNNGWAYGVRAAANLGKGEHAQAIDDARTCLDIMPDNQFARNTLECAERQQAEAESIEGYSEIGRNSSSYSFTASSLPSDIGAEEDVEFELALDDSPSSAESGVCLNADMPGERGKTHAVQDCPERERRYQHRGFSQRFGGAFKGLGLGIFYGVVAGGVLRTIGGLIAWPFGWEIGGWLAWLTWSAMMLGALLAIGFWFTHAHDM